MGYFEIIWMLVSYRYTVIAFVSLISAFTTLWEKRNRLFESAINL